MAATIQTIQKPTKARALDTSGNNNHGQIYSGRALEFDGVSDYLDPPNSGPSKFSSVDSVSFFNGNTSDSNFVTNASGNVVPVQATTCMWLYTKSFADVQYVQESGGGEWSIYLQTSGKIQVGYLNDNYTVDTDNDSPRYVTSSLLKLNTWYRLVVVWNMQEGTASDVFKVYINGVLDTGGTSNEMGSTGTRAYKRITPDYSLRIGCYGSGSRDFFNGYLSDYQIWDKNFTQEDVTFDYLNPESLALNRGGTSLTNSNLRLWYPMNDGHRGQQSYILDASNTGLGDEMSEAVNGNSSNWTKYSNNTLSTDNGAVLITYVDNSDGAYMYIRESKDLNSDLTIGVTYKVELDIKTNGTVAYHVNSNGAYPLNTTVTNTEFETYTAYFTATSATNNFIRIASMGAGEKAWFKNLSVKPVNDKNHATTVFYGDDLWNAADNNVTIWTASHGSAETVIGGSTDGGKIVYGAHVSSGHSSLTYLRSETNSQDVLDTDLIIGRQYSLEGYYATDVAGSGNRTSVGVYSGSWTWPNEAQTNIVTATNLVSNPGFETAGGGGADIWANWTENAGSGTLANDTSNEHNGDDCASLTTVSTNLCNVVQTITVEAGTHYLVSYWSKSGHASDAGSVRHRVLNANDGDSAIIDSEYSGNQSTNWAQTTFQFYTPTGCTSAKIQFISSSGNYTAFVDDVLITKFVRRTIDFTATHATTNYLAHSDGVTADYIAAIDASNSDFGTGPYHWEEFGTGANAPNFTGGGMTFLTTTASGSQGVDLAVDKFTGLEIGRDYILRLQAGSSSGTPTLKVRVGDSNIATQAIDTDATTSYVFTLTPTTTTGKIKIYNESSTAYTFTIDNVTLHAKCNLYYDDITFKEIGTASGWTDADQQLDIPQTALQSYNQLAWFPGQEGSDVTLDTTIDTLATAWSFSFWLFNMESGNSFDFIIGAGSNRNLAVDNNSNRKLYYRDGDGVYNALSDEVIPEGKWLHIVVTAIADTSITAYINGEAQTTSTTMAYGGSDPDTQLIVDRFMEGYSAGNYESRGSITEISYFANTTLNQAQVNTLYNDGKAYDVEKDTTLWSACTAYWRNNGLAEWQDRKGTNDLNTNGVTETMLITAGVDGSRDSQGFLMNRQRTTNSLNNTLGTSGGKSYVQMNVKGDDDLAFIGVGHGFSVSVWVKSSHLNSSNEMIVSRNDNTDGWRLQLDSANKLQFVIEENNNLSTAITDSAILVDTWYHMVGTFNGDPSNNGSGVTKLYINGITGGSTTNDGAASNDMDAVTDTMYIGRHTTLSDVFNGEIDDLCIYNKVLSQEEVTRNYNAGKRSHR